MKVKNILNNNIGEVYSQNSNEVWVHFYGIYHGYNTCYTREEFEKNFIFFN